MIPKPAQPFPIISRSTRLALMLGLATLLASGCSMRKEDDGANATSGTTAPANQAAGTDTAAPATSFDINTLPVSTVPLGEFPYFTLPTGYTTEGKEGDTKDFARFPFWVKGAQQWIEGKFYQTGFKAEPGKGFSIFEVAKNFDNAITQLGGRKVSEEEIPSEIRNNLGPEIKRGFYFPMYGAIGNPTHVWAIRRADGNIWVMLAGDETAAGYIVAKEAPLTQTTQMIPAAELKQAIDTAGKVALSVNFATDKTDILPSSQPQIDQVLQLLTDDPALNLAIGGHTDNSGDKAHNQRLSEGRAQSVVAALVAKGISSSRLTAKGFGDSQPVAGNDTEEGKARNRRVELVKR